jgi:hypothetical protein
MDREELMDRVEEIARLAKRARAAEIDAGACQTRHDFNEAHAASLTFEEAIDKLRSDLIVEEARDAAHRARCEVARHQGAIVNAQNMLAAARREEAKTEQAHQDALAARIALNTENDHNPRD